MKYVKSDFNEYAKDKYDDNLTNFRLKEKEPAMLRPDYSKFEKEKKKYEETEYYSQPMIQMEKNKSSKNEGVVINSSNGQIISQNKEAVASTSSNTGVKAVAATIAALFIYNQIG